MALSRRRAKLVGRLGHRKTREREGLVLVEGVRAAADVLDAGAGLRFALVSPWLEGTAEGKALRARLETAGVDVDEVENAELAELADTENPQGVLLVCAEPRPAAADVLRTGARCLLLDAVQDPGNAGTLVRAATAFGLDGVVALDGTVDPWSPKAVRAAAGMAFRIPVLTARWEEVGPLLASSGLTLLVADAGGEPPPDTAPAGGWALAVGNEAAGPRAEVLEAAGTVVRVPMPGPAESLNVGVAGSILLYALTKEASGVPAR